MIIDKSGSPIATEAPPLPPKAGAPPYPQSEGSIPADEPPPYAGPSTVQERSGAPPTLRHNSHLQSVAEQEVNHLVIVSRHNGVSGSYVVNTELPQLETKLATHRRGNALDRKNQKMFGKLKRAAPNASVHTRHGAILLNIATSGRSLAPSKAHVQVSSRHGKAHVNVYALQENKRICLEVSTRHGNIVVFVPPNFAGTLQLRTRRGNIRFLPEFERNARLVNASDNGALVLFGQGVQTPVMDVNDLSSDSCLLSTRHGRIILGVSGADHYDEVQGPGLLEKLGSLSTLFLGKDYVTKPVQEMSKRLQPLQELNRPR